ncbi:hypothetical protein QBC36DRAFT_314848, partial [Triangularia setosa]
AVAANILRQTFDNSEIEDALIANIYYLKPDPLYDEEKPYSSASDPPPDRLDEYMDEMSEISRRHLGACKVVVYDHVSYNTYRRFVGRAALARNGLHGASRKVKRHILGAHLCEQGSLESKNSSGRERREVLLTVSVALPDISKESAETRIRLKCGEEAETLLKRWWHIVKKLIVTQSYPYASVWRPLQEPVMSMLLARCDSPSLRDDDLVPADVIYPHLELEASELWFNSNQRWYYLKGQMMKKVLLVMKR